MSNMLKITPGGEIKWQVHDTADGRLYLPPTHDETFDPMNIFDQVDEDRNRHKQLGMGKEGVVYDIASYAVKAFIKPFDKGNINTLRVNVALTEGLKRIAQPQNSSFEIRGAEIYAAFIPDEASADELGYRAIWLMEKIDPPMQVSRYLRERTSLFGRKLNKLRPLPNSWQRRATYDLALRKYGYEFDDIINDEDDSQDLNLLIGALPEGRARGQLVKIDERPNSGS